MDTFDLGIAFEPNTGGAGQAAGSSGCNGNDAINASIVAGQNIAGAGCDRLASTTTGDISRRRNTLDVGVRYRGTFGPLGLAAYANYIGSSTVEDSTPAGFAGFVPRNRLGGLNLGVGGITVTWNGLTVGGMVQGGWFNGQWALAPTGSSDSLAWLAGISYTYGPIVVGASYYQYDSPGASGPAGTGTGTTTTAPGFSPFVGQRRERGVAAGGGPIPLHRAWLCLPPIFGATAKRTGTILLPLRPTQQPVLPRGRCTIQSIRRSSPWAQVLPGNSGRSPARHCRTRTSRH